MENTSDIVQNINEWNTVEIIDFFNSITVWRGSSGGFGKVRPGYILHEDVTDIQMSRRAMLHSRAKQYFLEMKAQEKYISCIGALKRAYGTYVHRGYKWW